MIKKFLYFCFFLMFAIQSSDVQAQPGFGRGGGGLFMGPLGIQYDYFDSSGISQLMLTLSHHIPIGRGAPRDSTRMSQVIRVSFLDAGIGVRFGGVLDSSEFRWRVKVLEADFTKWLFSFGATIADLDQSGLKEKENRWVNIRLGLQPRIRLWKLIASPFVLGFAGLGEWRLGNIHYAALGDIADSTFSGPESGYRAGVSVILFPLFRLTADYGMRTISYGPDPQFTTWSVEIHLLPGRGFLRRFSPFVRFEIEKAKLKDSGENGENRHIQVGIMLPMRRGR
jgi:hypothetical protein